MLDILTEDFRTQTALISENVIAEYKSQVGGGIGLSRYSPGSEEYFKYISFTAWDNLMTLYHRDKINLDKYTQKSRSEFPGDYRFNVEFFKNSPGYSLETMLRLIQEYSFWVKNGEYRVDEVLLRNETYRDLGKTINPHYSGRYESVITDFRFSLARDFLDSADFKSLRGLVENLNDEQNKLNSSINKVAAETVKVNSLSAKLDNFKVDLAFLGLSKAFARMKKTKDSERKWAQGRFWVVTILLIAVPGLSFYNFNVSADISWQMLILKYAPLVTLELLLLYYMRLFYSEAKAVKAQLLQVDHRMALCAFIQEYVTYRENNEKSKEAFAGFESLIFSPVQAKEDNIPSMLDGAGAIADLMGKVMSKGKGGD